MKTKDMNKTTKVNIVTGFLGVGKTTFIKKYLNEIDKTKKVVILENEFGEVSVDAKILNEENLSIYEINAGCICCSLLFDFKKSIDYILKNYNPDIIIIEPSGIAKVSDIIKILDDFQNINLDKIITVVNSFTFDTYLETFGDFYKDQIKNANIILLTRVDKLIKIRKNSLKKLTENLKYLNPNAQIIDKNLNDFNVNDIFYKRLNSTKDNFIYEKYNQSLNFSSYTFNIKKSYSKEEVNILLSEFINIEKYGIILRAKGFLKEHSGGYIKFDYVDGEIHIEKKDGFANTDVVVIGENLNKKRINILFEKLSY